MMTAEQRKELRALAKTADRQTREDLVLDLAERDTFTFGIAMGALGAPAESEFELLKRHTKRN